MCNHGVLDATLRCIDCRSPHSPNGYVWNESLQTYIKNRPPVAAELRAELQAEAEAELRAELRAELMFRIAMDADRPFRIYEGTDLIAEFKTGPMATFFMTTWKGE